MSIPTPDNRNHPIRHASNGRGAPLCGSTVEHLRKVPSRFTQPKEAVNCPECRVVLNHVRDRYPEHASYTDWRLTAEEQRRAAADFVADMHGGADD